MGVFTFSLVNGKHHFWANLVQKIKIVDLFWNLVVKSNSNMKNSMGMFTFSVINGKHLFWVNSVEIFKFVNLTRNSVLRLIQICRVQWICSLLLLWTGNTVLGKFGPNIQIYQFKLKFGAQTNSNMQNWMEMFTFSVFNGKHRFGEICSKYSNLSIYPEIWCSD